MKKNTIEQLFGILSQSKNQEAFEEALLRDECTYVKGLVGSGFSFRLATAFKKLKKTTLVILENPEQAAYYLNDMEGLLKSSEVLYFPASYRQAYNPEATDNANVLLRSEVLKKISNSKKPQLIISYPDAIFEKVISQQTLKKKTLQVNKGDLLNLDFINETLFEYGFDRVNFVTQPGEFSVRGGIIDVFSFSHQHPYRIEFFGDEVESLRSFDVNTQLSIGILDKLDLLPNTSLISFTEKRKTLIESLPKQSSLIIDQVDLCLDRMDLLFKKSIKEFEKVESGIQFPPETLFTRKAAMSELLKNRGIIILSNSEYLKPNRTLLIKQSPQPSINKQFDRLIEILNENHEQGYSNWIFCTSEAQRKRLNDIFQEMQITVHYKTEVCPLYIGFEDLDVKLACFTDHQIFERYHKYNLKSAAAKKETLTLKELTHLNVGDFVTHIDHGIGEFGGLKKIDVEGVQQEAIKLI